MTQNAPALSAFSGLPKRQTPSAAWAASILASILVILAPAVWNGFPFMFYDTGAFLSLAIEGGFKPERSSFYAYFLAAFGPRFSLWPAAIAQVALTVLAMAGFARLLVPSLSPLRFFALILALCAFTSLPWNAADLLPDILAPLMVLSLYLLAFRSAGLSRWQKAALFALAVFGAVSHASHLGLVAGLVAVVALMQLALRRVQSGPVSPRAGLPAMVFGLSLLAMIASNYAHTGRVFISRSGPSFLVGRLIQDGIVKRVLDDTCPISGYRLCAYKDHLSPDGTDFLWSYNSPFDALGQFDGFYDEASDIIGVSLKQYPWMNLKAAAADLSEQLVTFRTGDGVEPLSGVPDPIFKRLMPDMLDDYLASRQQRGAFDFGWINAVQVPLGGLSILWLATILIRAILRQDWGDRLYLPAFLLCALLGNAFICGVLSGPQHRYQSRLMWAVSFVALLLSARAFELSFWRNLLARVRMPRGRLSDDQDIEAVT